MAYTNNKFCWHGIITTNVDKAKAFYAEAIGWDTTKMQMGDETATMVTVGGIPRAHIMLPPMEGVPPHISSYLRVEDVDSGTEAAVANGGAVVVPPTDIPPGRFSGVSSPSGAVFMLFHEADESTAQNPPAGDGAIHWVELHSTDVDADIAWLTNSFGITTSEMPMPNGGTYTYSTTGRRRSAAAWPLCSPICRRTGSYGSPSPRGRRGRSRMAAPPPPRLLIGITRAERREANERSTVRPRRRGLAATADRRSFSVCDQIAHRDVTPAVSAYAIAVG